MTAQFTDKFKEYNQSINNHMVIFEVTKCCKYSTLVTIYKTQTLNDLHNTIFHHMGLTDLSFKLFFISNETGLNISVPFSYMNVYEFIKLHNTCSPARIVPIYPIPDPVVYRIFIDYGPAHEH